MDKLSIYEYANKNIIDYTGQDSTANILKEYAVYGMYNLLSTIDEIGGNVETTKLIALPDFTFSKNDHRWKAGYPYGSIIYIDTNNIPFMPLGFRPNCCGITMCKISKSSIDPTVIMKKVQNLSNLKLDLSNDDLKRGNHFIGTYYDNTKDEYYAIIHGSFSFVKSGYHNLPGLYIDKTDYWNKKKKIYNTKYTSFEYLIEDAACEYYEVFNNFEKITKENRKKITEFIFEGCEILFNETHEGLFNFHTIALGAYVMDHPFLCPIMLSAETDMPIIKINNAISSFQNVQIFACPHGGGYLLSNIKDGHYIVNDSCYELTYTNNARLITSDIRNLIHTYRTNTDRIWVDTYNLGSYEKNLITLNNFKL